MTSGGARARSGPAPDPNALRRDRKNDGEWLVLPAEGRRGLSPKWPLSEAAADEWKTREIQLWHQLWAMPQAVQWERQRQELQVALYVRRLVEAESPGSSAAAGTLARQQADALGLTLPGLRALRWKIAVDQVADKRQQHGAAAGGAGRSSRDRFRVVPPPEVREDKPDDQPPAG